MFKNVLVCFYFQEFKNIIYGVLYFLVVFMILMLMLIYVFGNFYVILWGIRELNKIKKRKN